MTTVAAINSMGGCAHNPRGNLWFNDESTFGHKLLMKMGWSKGKGLGKNEDGIKENLSVKFRNTNSGLGYKDDPYANVMKTEYEAILKDLSANYPQKETLSDEKSASKQKNGSSEQMSKVVKSKMRYPKLFFGKDVTKYSENDMKSIFICSLPSKDNQDKPEDSVPSEKQESEVEFLPKGDQTYSSSLSISDYFAKKMKEKKSNGLPEAASDSSSQQRSSLDSEIDKTNNSSKRVSKKKGKNSEINTNQEFNNDSEKQQTELGFEVVGETDNLTRKKSSKRKRKKTELNMNGINTDSPQNDTETECVAPSNKKKRKLQENIASGEKVSKIEIHENGETSNNNSPISSKKKRKRKVNENSSANIITNEAVGGKISCQIELSSEKALQLKKKRKLWDEKNNCISNDIHKLSSDNSQISNDLPSSVSIKNDLDNNNVVCSKKKKKKSKKIKFKKLKSCLKNKAASFSLKNVSFSEHVSFRVIDTDYESVECLSDASNILQANITDEIDVVNSVNENESESGVSIPDTQTVNSDDPKNNNDSAAVGEVRELKESYSLSSLPSPKSDHYNSWIESQRQALKMKMYKSMLKSLKKHKILKSSNLLSIKGYGNWIF